MSASAKLTADAPVLHIHDDGSVPAAVTLRILNTHEAGRRVLCEALADEVLLCIADVRDRASRMLRWKEYQERFQSNFAGRAILVAGRAASGSPVPLLSLFPPDGSEQSWDGKGA